LATDFSKKCQGTFFEIIGVFDQVKGGEHEYEQKTGTRSSFRRHFGKNQENVVFSQSDISVVMGCARSIFWVVVQSTGRNIYVKFQGRSSRSLYFSHWSLIIMPGIKSASEATYNSTLELDIPDLFSQSDTRTRYSRPVFTVRYYPTGTARRASFVGIRDCFKMTGLKLKRSSNFASNAKFTKSECRHYELP